MNCGRRWARLKRRRNGTRKINPFRCLFLLLFCFSSQRQRLSPIYGMCKSVVASQLLDTRGHKFINMPAWSPSARASIRASTCLTTARWMPDTKIVIKKKNNNKTARERERERERRQSTSRMANFPHQRRISHLSIVSTILGSRRMGRETLKCIGRISAFNVPAVILLSRISFVTENVVTWHLNCTYCI